MSAYYAVAYPDRVEILMDGVSYDDDGTILEIRSKIWVSDTLPLAFAGRGPTASIDIIGLALGTLSVGRTFDEAVTLFREKIESMASKPGERAQIDGAVAGISETLGPVIFYFHTYPNGLGDCQPWKFYDAGGEALGAPCPTPQECKASGIPMHWACDGLEEYGGDFFELLRKQEAWRSEEYAKDRFWGIGGHVEHTVIKAEGTTTKRILEWPDQVGDKLDGTSPYDELVKSVHRTAKAISEATPEERAKLPLDMLEKADKIVAGFAELANEPH